MGRMKYVNFRKRKEIIRWYEDVSRGKKDVANLPPLTEIHI
ncbi:MAG: hypothetical protein QXN66_03915 [Thermoplasmatales archaeon]